MTAAFDRVMAEPASLAARCALLDEWKSRGDPRALLLDKQLAYREIAWVDRATGPARRLDAEIDALIARHGREWAGRVADLVDGWTFHRGLVAQVDVPGERFLQVAPELVALAPIQHVNLKAPTRSCSRTSAGPEPSLMRSPSPGSWCSR